MIKVLYSGYYNPNFGTMTACIERALESLGISLKIFDWYKFYIPGRIRERFPNIHQLELKRINRALLKKTEQFKPDILLVVGGFTIFPETIIKIKKMANLVTVNWIADYPRNFELQLKPGIHYDYFFVSGTDALIKYQQTGHTNGYWLPFACDPNIHKPLQLSSEDRNKYKCDICFVGSNYPERLEILEKLAIFDLGIWGIGWEKLPKNSQLKPCIRGGMVDPVEWVKIFNASKIVLNITPRRALIKEPYIYQMDEKEFRMCNTRVFEILGCGAFQLVDAKPDAMTLFKDREHLVFYHNKAELIELADFYLNNDAERIRIAQNGWQEAIGRHTYKHRIKEILSVADGYINN